MLQKVVVEVVAQGSTMENVVATLLGLHSHGPDVSITIEREVVRNAPLPDEAFEEMLKNIMDNGSSL